MKNPEKVQMSIGYRL